HRAGAALGRARRGARGPVAADAFLRPRAAVDRATGDGPIDTKGPGGRRMTEQEGACDDQAASCRTALSRSPNDPHRASRVASRDGISLPLSGGESVV